MFVLFLFFKLLLFFLTTYTYILQGQSFLVRWFPLLLQQLPWQFPWQKMNPVMTVPHNPQVTEFCVRRHLNLLWWHEIRENKEKISKQALCFSFLTNSTFVLYQSDLCFEKKNAKKAIYRNQLSNYTMWPSGHLENLSSRFSFQNEGIFSSSLLFTFVYSSLWFLVCYKI